MDEQFAEGQRQIPRLAPQNLSRVRLVAGVDRSVRISGRREQTTNGERAVGFSVDGLGPTELHFGVPEAHAEFISGGFDAAAVALLIPVMAEGGRLDVDGPMTPELVWTLNEYVVPLLRLALPNLEPAYVTATETLEESGGDAVLTGLSGGVDSLNVCLDHLIDDAVPFSLRVTHFLFNDVGSHGAKRELALDRLARCSSLADELGRPLIRVTSNLAAFYQLNFQATHTIRNASVPLLLQAGARSWLYASGYPLSAAHAGPTHDLASIDPILLPSLSTPRVHLYPVGGTLTRVEKTRRIAEWPIAHDYIDICTRSVPNCGQCRKCLRTLLTLDVLGSIDLFEDSFDLAAYRRQRGRYMARVIASNDVLLREISELMEATDFKRSLPIRAKAAAHRFTGLTTPVTRWAKSQPRLRQLARSKVGRAMLRR